MWYLVQYLPIDIFFHSLLCPFLTYLVRRNSYACRLHTNQAPGIMLWMDTTYDIYFHTDASGCFSIGQHTTHKIILTCTWHPDPIIVQQHLQHLQQYVFSTASIPLQPQALHTKLTLGSCRICCRQGPPAHLWLHNSTLLHARQNEGSATASKGGDLGQQNNLVE